jgi:hypothetical protein
MASAARPLIVALVGIEGLYTINVFSAAMLVPQSLPQHVKFIVMLKTSDDNEMSELHDYIFAPLDTCLPKHAACTCGLTEVELCDINSCNDRM